MKFKHKPEEVFTKSEKIRLVWRPITPILLLKGTNLVGYEALIDSGADNNVFHSEISDILGIKLTSGKLRKIYGLGCSSIKGYLHELEIKPIGMSSYRTSVIFSKDIPNHSIGVLGNQGFFNKFQIKFDYKKKTIDIS